MSEISAKLVVELRELTGAGMMECKKALIEAAGDLKKAVEILRIKNGAKAEKISGRIAAEGIVTIYITADKKSGTILEINSETDFVAKDKSFLEFASFVAKYATDNHIKDVAEFLLTKNNICIDTMRKELIAKIGENITIRRLDNKQAKGNLFSYIHGAGKVGVLVDIDTTNETLAKDIAMHIVASKPICVSEENVDANLIETEKNIYKQQAATSGKSPEIIEKMIEGRIKKYLAEITLLGQNFVKNPEITIKELLTKEKAKVYSFDLFTVGAGLEKKVTNFRD